MIVLRASNVNQILPAAVNLLLTSGVARSSRDGDVLQFPQPVSTVYSCPWQRVLFTPVRDANPFFHLFESLWMLAGRNDVEPLKKFVKSFDRFSDNGSTLHGAYGYRWREQFGFDQLESIASILRGNKNDRRCVLQMWDASLDLGTNGLDVPCNTIATFQVDTLGFLQLVVFCRSNDIIMGAYGANVVQFSILHEFMSAWTNIPMGTYTQISVNWHAYQRDLNRFRALAQGDADDPYDRKVHSLRMAERFEYDKFIHEVHELLMNYNTGLIYGAEPPTTPWLKMAHAMMYAHFLHRNGKTSSAIDHLTLHAEQGVDFIEAGKAWLIRRLK